MAEQLFAQFIENQRNMEEVLRCIAANIVRGRDCDISQGDEPN
jgi:hypothetical protein